MRFKLVLFVVCLQLVHSSLAGTRISQDQRDTRITEPRFHLWNGSTPERLSETSQLENEQVRNSATGLPSLQISNVSVQKLFPKDNEKEEFWIKDQDGHASLENESSKNVGAQVSSRIPISQGLSRNEDSSAVHRWRRWSSTTSNEEQLPSSLLISSTGNEGVPETNSMPNNDVLETITHDTLSTTQVQNPDTPINIGELVEDNDHTNEELTGPSSNESEINSIESDLSKLLNIRTDNKNIKRKKKGSRKKTIITLPGGIKITIKRPKSPRNATTSRIAGSQSITGHGVPQRQSSAVNIGSNPLTNNDANFNTTDHGKMIRQPIGTNQHGGITNRHSLPPQPPKIPFNNPRNPTNGNVPTIGSLGGANKGKPEESESSLLKESIPRVIANSSSSILSKHDIINPMQSLRNKFSNILNRNLTNVIPSLNVNRTQPSDPQKWPLRFPPKPVEENDSESNNQEGKPRTLPTDTVVWHNTQGHTTKMLNDTPYLSNPDIIPKSDVSPGPGSSRTPLIPGHDKRKDIYDDDVPKNPKTWIGNELPAAPKPNIHLQELQINEKDLVSGKEKVPPTHIDRKLESSSEDNAHNSRFPKLNFNFTNLLRPLQENNQKRPWGFEIPSLTQRNRTMDFSSIGRTVPQTSVQNKQENISVPQRGAHSPNGISNSSPPASKTIPNISRDSPNMVPLPPRIPNSGKTSEHNPLDRIGSLHEESKTGVLQLPTENNNSPKQEVPSPGKLNNHPSGSNSIPRTSTGIESSSEDNTHNSRFPKLNLNFTNLLRPLQGNNQKRPWGFEIPSLTQRNRTMDFGSIGRTVPQTSVQNKQENIPVPQRGAHSPTALPNSSPPVSKTIPNISRDSPNLVKLPPRIPNSDKMWEHNPLDRIGSQHEESKTGVLQLPTENNNSPKQEVPSKEKLNNLPSGSNSIPRTSTGIESSSEDNTHNSRFPKLNLNFTNLLRPLQGNNQKRPWGFEIPSLTQRNRTMDFGSIGRRVPQTSVQNKQENIPIPQRGAHSPTALPNSSPPVSKTIPNISRDSPNMVPLPPRIPNSDKMWEHNPLDRIGSQHEESKTGVLQLPTENNNSPKHEVPSQEKLNNLPSGSNSIPRTSTGIESSSEDNTHNSRFPKLNFNFTNLLRPLQGNNQKRPWGFEIPSLAQRNRTMDLGSIGRTVPQTSVQNKQENIPVPQRGAHSPTALPNSSPSVSKTMPNISRDSPNMVPLLPRIPNSGKTSEHNPLDMIGSQHEESKTGVLQLPTENNNSPKQEVPSQEKLNNLPSGSNSIPRTSTGIESSSEDNTHNSRFPKLNLNFTNLLRPLQGNNQKRPWGFEIPSLTQRNRTMDFGSIGRTVPQTSVQNKQENIPVPQRGAHSPTALPNSSPSVSKTMPNISRDSPNMVPLLPRIPNSGKTSEHNPLDRIGSQHEESKTGVLQLPTENNNSPKQEVPSQEKLNNHPSGSNSIPRTSTGIESSSEDNTHNSRFPKLNLNFTNLLRPLQGNNQKRPWGFEIPSLAQRNRTMDFGSIGRTVPQTSVQNKQDNTPIPQKGTTLSFNSIPNSHPASKTIPNISRDLPKTVTLPPHIPKTDDKTSEFISLDRINSKKEHTENGFPEISTARWNIPDVEKPSQEKDKNKPSESNSIPRTTKGIDSDPFSDANTRNPNFPKLNFNFTNLLRPLQGNNPKRNWGFEIPSLTQRNRTMEFGNIGRPVAQTSVQNKQENSTIPQRGTINSLNNIPNSSPQVTKTISNKSADFPNIVLLPPRIPNNEKTPEINPVDRIKINMEHPEDGYPIQPIESSDSPKLAVPPQEGLKNHPTDTTSIPRSSKEIISSSEDLTKNPKFPKLNFNFTNLLRPLQGNNLKRPWEFEIPSLTQRNRTMDFGNIGRPVPQTSVQNKQEGTPIPPKGTTHFLSNIPNSPLPTSNTVPNIPRDLPNTVTFPPYIPNSEKTSELNPIDRINSNKVHIENGYPRIPTESWNAPKLEETVHENHDNKPSDSNSIPRTTKGIESDSFSGGNTRNPNFPKLNFNFTNLLRPLQVNNQNRPWGFEILSLTQRNRTMDFGNIGRPVPQTSVQNKQEGTPIPPRGTTHSLSNIPNSPLPASSTVPNIPRDLPNTVTFPPYIPNSEKTSELNPIDRINSNKVHIENGYPRIPTESWNVPKLEETVQENHDNKPSDSNSIPRTIKGIESDSFSGGNTRNPNFPKLNFNFTNLLRPLQVNNQNRPWGFEIPSLTQRNRTMDFGNIGRPVPQTSVQNKQVGTPIPPRGTTHSLSNIPNSPLPASNTVPNIPRDLPNTFTFPPYIPNSEKTSELNPIDRINSNKVHIENGYPRIPTESWNVPKLEETVQENHDNKPSDSNSIPRTTKGIESDYFSGGNTRNPNFPKLNFNFTNLLSPLQVNNQNRPWGFEIPSLTQRNRTMDFGNIGRPVPQTSVQNKQEGTPIPPRGTTHSLSNIPNSPLPASNTVPNIPRDLPNTVTFPPYIPNSEKTSELNPIDRINSNKVHIENGYPRIPTESWNVPKLEETVQENHDNKPSDSNSIPRTTKGIESDSFSGGNTRNPNFPKLNFNFTNLLRPLQVNNQNRPWGFEIPSLTQRNRTMDFGNIGRPVPQTSVQNKQDGTPIPPRGTTHSLSNIPKNSPLPASNTVPNIPRDLPNTVTFPPYIPNSEKTSELNPIDRINSNKVHIENGYPRITTESWNVPKLEETVQENHDNKPSDSNSIPRTTKGIESDSFSGGNTRNPNFPKLNFNFTNLLRPLQVNNQNRPWGFEIPSLTQRNRTMDFGNIGRPVPQTSVQNKQVGTPIPPRGTTHSLSNIPNPPLPASNTVPNIPRDLPNTFTFPPYIPNSEKTSELNPIDRINSNKVHIENGYPRIPTESWNVPKLEETVQENHDNKPSDSNSIPRTTKGIESDSFSGGNTRNPNFPKLNFNFTNLLRPLQVNNQNRPWGFEMPSLTQRNKTMDFGNIGRPVPQTSVQNKQDGTPIPPRGTTHSLSTIPNSPLPASNTVPNIPRDLPNTVTFPPYIPNSEKTSEFNPIDKINSNKVHIGNGYPGIPTESWNVPKLEEASQERHDNKPSDSNSIPRATKGIDSDSISEGNAHIPRFPKFNLNFTNLLRPIQENNQKTPWGFEMPSLTQRNRTLDFGTIGRTAPQTSVQNKQENIPVPHRGTTHSLNSSLPASITKPNMPWDLPNFVSFPPQFPNSEKTSGLTPLDTIVNKDENIQTGFPELPTESWSFPKVEVLSQGKLGNKPSNSNSVPRTTNGIDSESISEGNAHIPRFPKFNFNFTNLMRPLQENNQKTPWAFEMPSFTQRNRTLDFDDIGRTVPQTSVLNKQETIPVPQRGAHFPNAIPNASPPVSKTIPNVSRDSPNMVSLPPRIPNSGKTQELNPLHKIITKDENHQTGFPELPTIINNFPKVEVPGATSGIDSDSFSEGNAHNTIFPKSSFNFTNLLTPLQGRNQMRPSPNLVTFPPQIPRELNPLGRINNNKENTGNRFPELTRDSWKSPEQEKLNNQFSVSNWIPRATKGSDSFYRDNTNNPRFPMFNLTNLLRPLHGNNQMNPRAMEVPSPTERNKTIEFGKIDRPFSNTIEPNQLSQPPGLQKKTTSYPDGERSTVPVANTMQNSFRELPNFTIPSRIQGNSNNFDFNQLIRIPSQKLKDGKELPALPTVNWNLPKLEIPSQQHLNEEPVDFSRPLEFITPTNTRGTSLRFPSFFPTSMEQRSAITPNRNLIQPEVNSPIKEEDYVLRSALPSSEPYLESMNINKNQSDEPPDPQRIWVNNKRPQKDNLPTLPIFNNVIPFNDTSNTKVPNMSTSSFWPFPFGRTDMNISPRNEHSSQNSMPESINNWVPRRVPDDKLIYPEILKPVNSNSLRETNKMTLPKDGKPSVYLWPKHFEKPENAPRPIRDPSQKFGEGRLFDLPVSNRNFGFKPKAQNLDTKLPVTHLTPMLPSKHNEENGSLDSNYDFLSNPLSFIHPRPTKNGEDIDQINQSSQKTFPSHVPSRFLPISLRNNDNKGDNLKTHDAPEVALSNKTNILAPLFSSYRPSNLMNNKKERVVSQSPVWTHSPFDDREEGTSRPPMESIPRSGNGLLKYDDNVIQEPKNDNIAGEIRRPWELRESVDEKDLRRPVMPNQPVPISNKSPESSDMLQNPQFGLFPFGQNAWRSEGNRTPNVERNINMPVQNSKSGEEITHSKAVPPSHSITDPVIKNVDMNRGHSKPAFSRWPAINWENVDVNESVPFEGPSISPPPIFKENNKGFSNIGSTPSVSLRPDIEERPPSMDPEAFLSRASSHPNIPGVQLYDKISNVNEQLRTPIQYSEHFKGMPMERRVSPPEFISAGNDKNERNDKTIPISRFPIWSNFPENRQQIQNKEETVPFGDEVSRPRFVTVPSSLRHEQDRGRGDISWFPIMGREPVESGTRRQVLPSVSEPQNNRNDIDHVNAPNQKTWESNGKQDGADPFSSRHGSQMGRLQGIPGINHPSTLDETSGKELYFKRPILPPLFRLSFATNNRSVLNGDNKPLPQSWYKLPLDNSKDEEASNTKVKFLPRSGSPSTELSPLNEIGSEPLMPKGPIQIKENYSQPDFITRRWQYNSSHHEDPILAPLFTSYNTKKTEKKGATTSISFDFSLLDVGRVKRNETPIKLKDQNLLLQLKSTNTPVGEQGDIDYSLKGISRSPNQYIQPKTMVTYEGHVLAPLFTLNAKNDVEINSNPKPKILRGLRPPENIGLPMIGDNNIEMIATPRSGTSLKFKQDPTLDVSWMFDETVPEYNEDNNKQGKGRSSTKQVPPSVIGKYNSPGTSRQVEPPPSWSIPLATITSVQTNKNTEFIPRKGPLVLDKPEEPTQYMNNNYEYDYEHLTNGKFMPRTDFVRPKLQPSENSYVLHPEVKPRSLVGKDEGRNVAVSRTVLPPLFVPKTQVRSTGVTFDSSEDIRDPAASTPRRETKLPLLKSKSSPRSGNLHIPNNRRWITPDSHEDNNDPGHLTNSRPVQPQSMTYNSSEDINDSQLPERNGRTSFHFMASKTAPRSGNSQSQNTRIWVPLDSSEDNGHTTNIKRIPPQLKTYQSSEDNDESAHFGPKRRIVVPRMTSVPSPRAGNIQLQNNRRWSASDSSEDMGDSTNVRLPPSSLMTYETLENTNDSPLSETNRHISFPFISSRKTPRSGNSQSQNTRIWSSLDSSEDNGDRTNIKQIPPQLTIYPSSEDNNDSVHPEARRRILLPWMTSVPRTRTGNVQLKNNRRWSPPNSSEDIEDITDSTNVRLSPPSLMTYDTSKTTNESPLSETNRPISFPFISSRTTPRSGNSQSQNNRIWSPLDSSEDKGDRTNSKRIPQQLTTYHSSADNNDSVLPETRRLILLPWMTSVPRSRTGNVQLQNNRRWSPPNSSEDMEDVTDSTNVRLSPPSLTIYDSAENNYDSPLSKTTRHISLPWMTLRAENLLNSNNRRWISSEDNGDLSLLENKRPTRNKAIPPKDIITNKKSTSRSGFVWNENPGVTNHHLAKVVPNNFPQEYYYESMNDEDRGGMPIEYPVEHSEERRNSFDKDSRHARHFWSRASNKNPGFTRPSGTDPWASSESEESKKPPPSLIHRLLRRWNLSEANTRSIMRTVQDSDFFTMSRFLNSRQSFLGRLRSIVQPYIT